MLSKEISAIAPYISKAHALTKEKRYDEAFEVLRPSFEKKEIPTFFEEPAGWVIYYYLKNNSAKLSSFQQRKLLMYYFDFSTAKNKILHSCIMRLAVNLEKSQPSTFRFIEFCMAWDLDNMTEDEDFKGGTFVTDNGKKATYYSLAENTVSCLYKEMKERHTEDFASFLLPFFRRVEQRCPENKFIPMYIARLLFWKGEREEAEKEYRQLLYKNPEWYLWSQYGEIVEDKELRTSFFCKALSMMEKEEYIGNLRLELAHLLMASNPAQASYEISKYVETYKEKGWKIDRDVQELYAVLTKKAVPTTDAQSFYLSQVAAAEDYVYSDIVPKKFIFIGIGLHNGKKRAQLQNIKNANWKVSVPLNRELRAAKKNDIFLLRTLHNAHQPLTIHATGQTFEEKVETVEGKLSAIKINAKGQRFAFVEDCYIGDRLIMNNNLTEGQLLKAQIVSAGDGRRVVKKILSVQ